MEAFAARLRTAIQPDSRKLGQSLIFASPETKVEGDGRKNLVNDT